MPPLLSGNGRHRRPRQAPNFVVAAGVTGAGLALPLLGATSASAADNATWDAVAECESGGLWSANDDNGFYGGLQIDQEAWERHGGTEYAGRPDLAGRDQQITVAERVLDSEGAELFGECAQSAGLSQDSPGSPDVDPDGTDDVADDPVAERPYPTDPSTVDPDGEGDGYGGAPDSGESADSGDSAGSGDSADSGESSGSPDSPDSPDSSPSEPTSPDPSAPEGSDGSADSGDGGAGDGEGGGFSYEPSDPVGPGDGVGDDWGERPSREGADGRDDAGQDGEGGETGQDGGAGDGEHRVSQGESLYSIADEEKVEGGWRELYDRNRELIGSDPGLILPGQELRL